MLCKQNALLKERFVFEIMAVGIDTLKYLHYWDYQNSAVCTLGATSVDKEVKCSLNVWKSDMYLQSTCCSKISW